jgi:glycosyltransferase involved in cell wall biosynthesis
MLDYLVHSRMQDVRLHHVRMTLSSEGTEVGKFRWSKILRIFPIVARVLRAWFVHRPQILYYTPAGVTTVGLLRDVVILGSTRFLFPKTVLHFHAGGHGDAYRKLTGFKRFLYRLAYVGHDAAVRLSEFAPDDGRQLESRSEFIVPNGIPDPAEDLELPRPAPEISATRPLRVLFVALLCESKGLLVLIDACAELAARGVPFHLELMGPFESEQFAETVRSRISHLHIEDRVTFLGLLTGEEKQAAFARADVLCHPTFNDTFGVVLVEAMACGIPVVATRWCSIPTIVDEGQSGFLVKPHDPGAVAECLATLAASPALRRQMGVAGREKFLREFTLARHIERMRQVFLDVALKTSTRREPIRETVEWQAHPEHPVVAGADDGARLH